MRGASVLLCLSFISGGPAPEGGEFPTAGISNGTVRVKLYLPDAKRGYYRGTRFDWSGVIASLEYQGHNYFGPWLESHDPRVHDSISGPVEQFRSGESALGYDAAQLGGTFVRIGVGVLRKANERRLNDFKTYEIVDPGEWTVTKGADWIEFVHTLSDGKGYAYSYSKRVWLKEGSPELVLDHSLKNLGRLNIDTSVYDHNFFVIDGQPTGPDFVVRFPFQPRATRDLNGLAETRGNELVYLRELQKGEKILTSLKGFSSRAEDYEVTIENRKVGAGVRITGDQPLSDLVYWSNRDTLCPEPYIKLKIEPGSEAKWRIAYRFHTFPATPRD